MLAISADDAETAKKFKASLKAPYAFVADEKKQLIEKYDVKMALIGIARRVTFVVGAGRKVLSVEEGSDALDPSGAVTACSLKKPEALKVITDGGR